MKNHLKLAFTGGHVGLLEALFAGNTMGIRLSQEAVNLLRESHNTQQDLGDNY